MISDIYGGPGREPPPAGGGAGVEGRRSAGRGYGRSECGQSKIHDMALESKDLARLAGGVGGVNAGRVKYVFAGRVKYVVLS